MRFRVLSLTMFAAFLMAACAPAPAPAPAPPAVDTAAEEQAIRAISATWLAAEQAKDATGILAHFAADASVAWSGDAPASGHDAIRALLEKNWAAEPKGMVSWSTESVRVSAAGDIAIEMGTWKTTGLGPDGTGSDTGKYMTYYRKMDGAWKVAADISTSSGQ